MLWQSLKFWIHPEDHLNRLSSSNKFWNFLSQNFPQKLDCRGFFYMQTTLLDFYQHLAVSGSEFSFVFPTTKNPPADSFLPIYTNCWKLSISSRSLNHILLIVFPLPTLFWSQHFKNSRRNSSWDFPKMIQNTFHMMVSDFIFLCFRML